MNARAAFARVLGAVALAACVGAPPDGTFACDGGAVTLHCGGNVQYCEQSVRGAAVTSAICRAMPAGCTEDPCRSCLSASHVPRLVACRFLLRGDLLQGTVQVAE